MFFFKQKTGYELRMRDWSSDVCASDLKVDRACGLEFAIARDRAKLQLVGKVVGHLGEKTELLILSGGIQVATNLEGVFLCTDIADQIGRASCRERVCQYV